jgi:hypothetical protein
MDVSIALDSLLPASSPSAGRQTRLSFCGNGSFSDNSAKAKESTLFFLSIPWKGASRPLTEKAGSSASYTAPRP